MHLYTLIKIQYVCTYAHTYVSELDNINLKQWFSWGQFFPPPQGTLEMSIDIFSCHTPGVEARNAAKHLAMQRTTPLLKKWGLVSQKY